MYQEYFVQKGVLILPIVAMASFILSFLAIVLGTLRPGSAAQQQSLAELPLDGTGPAQRRPETPAGAEKGVLP